LYGKFYSCFTARKARDAVLDVYKNKNKGDGVGAWVDGGSRVVAL
jgi:hypothetical protein